MTKPKLLLADDSATIRTVVERTFTEEGFDVTTVATGEEAMQKFAEIKPDIIIADVNMPEPTGYQICETIKKDEATKHIPVLLAAGSFEPFDQAEAERVAADGFLTKPFQYRDLIIRVDQLLGRNDLRAEPSETSDIESLYEQSFSDTPDTAIDEFGELMLGDAGMDDEIIEMSHPGDRASKFEVPVQSIEAADNHRHAPANGAVTQALAADEHPHRRFGDNSVVKPLRRKTDYLTPDDELTSEERSEAFIAAVTRRVVEKLSDQVIREIAMEEVPRITERLIREALDEGQNRER